MLFLFFSQNFLPGLLRIQPWLILYPRPCSKMLFSDAILYFFNHDIETQISYQRWVAYYNTLSKYKCVQRCHKQTTMYFYFPYKKTLCYYYINGIYNELVNFNIFRHYFSFKCVNENINKSITFYILTYKNGITRFAYMKCPTIFNVFAN